MNIRSRIKKEGKGKLPYYSMLLPIKNKNHIILYRRPCGMHGIKTVSWKSLKKLISY